MLNTLPQVGACHGCLSRIEDYLKAEIWIDRRTVFNESQSPTENNTDISSRPLTEASISLQLKYMQATNKENKSCRALVIDRINLKPAKDATLAIRDFSLNIMARLFTAITGPVGSGKTTLLLGILGEINPDSGQVHSSCREIGYCSQNSWLPNGTFREIVTGNQDVMDVDQTWYETAIHCCALDYDVAQLSEGHATQIGTNGVALSGGQKYRLVSALSVFSLLIEQLTRHLPELCMLGRIYYC